MKKIIALFLGLLFIPSLALAVTAVGWNTPTTITGYVLPNTINGTNQTIFAINGLFSIASSTFSSNLYFTSTGQGVVYVGSSGLVKTVATTTVSCAGTASCTSFVVFGNSPVTITGSGSGGSAYPFPLTGNATSTLTQFNGGLTAYATSTIGDGTQGGGLTISGGATTTGNALINGTLQLGGSSVIFGNGGAIGGIDIKGNGSASDNNYFEVLEASTFWVNQTHIRGSFNRGDSSLFTTTAVGGFAWSSDSQDNAPVDTALWRGGAQRVYVGNATPGDVSGGISFAYSSSTIYSSFAMASSTFYVGAGLTSCNGASNALTWSGGVFGCNSISGTGGSDPFNHPGANQSASTSQFAFGTSTISGYTLTLASSTAPQLALSAGAGIAQWTFRNAGGNFYLSTTTVAGTATTTKVALSITAAGLYTISTSTVGCVNTNTNGDLFVATCTSGGGTPGGTGTEVQYRAGASTFGAIANSAYNVTPNWLGFGTSTPQWLMQLASSTAPQLTLSDSINPHWTFRNSGGNLYIGTANATTFATSSTAAITWLSTGAEGLNDTTPDFRLEAVGSLTNGYFGLTNSVDGDIFSVLANGNVGIGSSTPWATLSVASSTFSDYTVPLFSVATSSNLRYGTLLSVFATSTLSGVSMNNGTSTGSGVSVNIGQSQNINNIPLQIDQLHVDGNINSTYSTVSCDVMSIGAAGTTVSDSANYCAPWGFQEDNNANIVATEEYGDISMKLNIVGNGNISNDGAMLAVGDATAWLSLTATTTPIMESLVKVETFNATGTSAIIGFTNTAPTGSSFEVQPTVGCYFNASTTKGNWQAVCQTSASAITQIDTGVASSSDTSAGNLSGRYYKLRIQVISSNLVKFFIGTSENNYIWQGSISTNIPIATTNTFPEVYVSRTTAGQSPSNLFVKRIQLWWKRGLFTS